MGKRYIDADLLLNGVYSDNPKDVMKYIAEFPTADVRENVRGEWKERHHAYSDEEAPIDEWQSARCSVCEKYHTTPYMYYFDDFNFCPNCGADMRGEKK